MNASSLRLVALSLLASLLFVSALRAQDDEEDFKPRSTAPPANRTGGASRGGEAVGEGAVGVAILAPAKTVGLTTREQPVLYWSLSADTTSPIEVVVTDPADRENPVVEAKLKGPTKAGLHKLSLAAPGAGTKPVKLAPGKKYDVVVEVVKSESTGSENPKATCFLMVVAPADVPPALKDEKDPARRMSLYAKEGVWFDYIDALTDAIAKNEKDEKLQQKRVRALESQGLIYNTGGIVTDDGARAARK